MTLWAGQHKPLALIPRIGQFCAIPRQQARLPIESGAARHADAGSVDQIMATTSITNAPLLPMSTG
ncbi:MAG TPA: hypothetical protein VMA34_21130 [Terracidiphilus sp.]|nr:hypothetical protein [Terracidiphilus sp.]